MKRQHRVPLTSAAVALLVAASCSGSPGTPALSVPADNAQSVAEAESPDVAKPRGAAKLLPVEQLWVDFCYYVVVARPGLATAYGQQLLIDATPEQLKACLARADLTTLRAMRLLDELGLHNPDLALVWGQISDLASWDPNF